MEKLLILNHDEVHELLPIATCIDVMGDALAALAQGDVAQPLRMLVRSSDPRGFLGLMPAHRAGNQPWWGLKEVCVFPGNPARGLDSHLGSVLLHDGETGRLVAVIEASSITAIRTAAVTALATDLLSRSESSTLAIIGTGTQARQHLRAIPHVRPIREIRIAGSSPERARSFIQTVAEPSEAELIGCDSVEEAVRGSDIVVTVTSSREPILRGDWLSPGCHVNLVGSSVRSAREADGAVMAAGPIWIDRRESTVNESGDYLMALEERAIDEGSIVAELGDVVLDRSKGRSSADEITIFKSLGLAIEDLAAAAFLYEKATETGAGTWIDF